MKPHAKSMTTLLSRIPRSRSFWVILSALLIGVVLLVGMLGARSGEPASTTAPKRSANQQQNQNSTPADMARRVADDVTAQGAVDAPVVMIEYADYRCPFCGLFARDTLPPLIEKYVDSGDLRIEWRDLPVFGEQSQLAAVAGRAAGEQNKFWEFNKAVFDIAPERGHADLTRDQLISIAEQVGVPDLKQFDADLDSPELAQAVDQDAQEAASLGATGTPSFLINGTPFVGAQPLEVFEKTIDAELAKAPGN